MGILAFVYIIYRQLYHTACGNDQQFNCCPTSKIIATSAVKIIAPIFSASYIKLVEGTQNPALERLKCVSSTTQQDTTRQPPRRGQPYFRQVLKAAVTVVGHINLRLAVHLTF